MAGSMKGCRSKRWDLQRFNDRSQRLNTSKILCRRRERPDGDTQVPESVRSVISSPGHSLEPSIQRAMEDRMGDSLCTFKQI